MGGKAKQHTHLHALQTAGDCAKYNSADDDNFTQVCISVLCCYVFKFLPLCAYNLSKPIVLVKFTPRHEIVTVMSDDTLD